MKPLPTRLLTILAASLGIVAADARADYMNWSYSTSAVPPGFSVMGADHGSGAVQLTPFTNAASASSIPVLAYATSATTPVTFNSASSAYTLTLTITDKTTHDSGSLTFNGSIAGSLGPTTSSLMNTFTTLQRSLTLDGHVYTVTLPSSAALEPPTKPQENILAKVSVSDAGSGGVVGAPEPASLLLGCLGFSVLGACGWWKRR